MQLIRYNAGLSSIAAPYAIEQKTYIRIADEPESSFYLAIHSLLNFRTALECSWNPRT